MPVHEDILLQQSQTEPRRSSPLVFVIQFLRRSFRRWYRRKAIAELSRLNDHLLRDIGISRNDIPRVVAGLLIHEEERMQGGRVLSSDAKNPSSDHPA